MTLTTYDASSLGVAVGSYALTTDGDSGAAPIAGAFVASVCACP